MNKKIWSNQKIKAKGIENKRRELYCMFKNKGNGNLLEPDLLQKSRELDVLVKKFYN